MTATTQSPSITPAPAESLAPAISLLALVRVEMRKCLNTRSGRWFTASVLGLVAIASGLGIIAFPEDSQTFTANLGLAGGILGYFLPVLTIMLVTSEWGQRTALATFALEPRRGRVVAAKMLAGLGLSFVVLALAAVIAAAATALSPLDGGSAVWSLELADLRSFVLANSIMVLIGFAIAMLLRNSAAAIVGYFVYTLIVPTVGAMLSALIDGFEEVLPWIEFNTAQSPLFMGDLQPTGQEWAQLAVSGLIWLVLPLVIGIARLTRAEIK